jgi:short-subunit dehydrogenase
MLMKLFAEEMKKRREGIIVNITSGAAEHIAVDDPAERDEGIVYGSSKAALNRLTNAIAHELRGYNIPVIAVDPGGTRTEVFELVASRTPDLSPSDAHPVEWPARVVAYVVTCPDPMEYSGKVIVTKPFVAEKGLA